MTPVFRESRNEEVSLTYSYSYSLDVLVFEYDTLKNLSVGLKFATAKSW